MRDQIVLDVGRSAKGNVYTASVLARPVNAIDGRVDNGVAIAWSNSVPTLELVMMRFVAVMFEPEYAKIAVAAFCR